jgi:hypothetical protein
VRKGHLASQKAAVGGRKNAILHKPIEKIEGSALNNFRERVVSLEALMQ